MTPTAERWPCERFFWSVLDAPGWSRAGPLPPGLLPAFADDVPADADELHAVCAPAGDGRLVVCAARRADLAQPARTLRSVTPERLPDALDATADPRSLELLCGPFEPRCVRRARLRRHAHAAGILLLCAALVAVGLARRAAHWSRVATDAHDACLAFAEAAAPGIPPEALAAELARLRALSAAAVRTPRDASLLLAAVLNAWPDDVAAEPQGLTVSQEGASVSVSVEGDPAPFLAAFRAPHGYRLEDPRLNASRGVTRLALRLRPHEGGAPP
ncbi:MAG: hypothetical protein KIS87_04375 [Phycisphaeraceae bacterium]|nr:hypothetical protein [Phycisphaeraceae bacterium]